MSSHLPKTITVVRRPQCPRCGNLCGATNQSEPSCYKVAGKPVLRMGDTSVLASRNSKGLHTISVDYGIVSLLQPILVGGERSVNPHILRLIILFMSHETTPWTWTFSVQVRRFRWQRERATQLRAGALCEAIERYSGGSR